MTDSSHYREEARRCRVLAASSTDAGAVQRWLDLAAQYEQLAVSSESPPLRRSAVRQNAS
jgi:hypothetical protein